jgi:hypothetical protein
MQKVAIATFCKRCCAIYITKTLPTQENCLDFRKAYGIITPVVFFQLMRLGMKYPIEKIDLHKMRQKDSILERNMLKGILDKLR